MTLDSNPPVSALDHLSCFPRTLISETFLKFYFLLRLVPLWVFTGQVGESGDVFTEPSNYLLINLCIWNMEQWSSCNNPER